MFFFGISAYGLSATDREEAECVTVIAEVGPRSLGHCSGTSVAAELASTRPSIAKGLSSAAPESATCCDGALGREQEARQVRVFSLDDWYVCPGVGQGGEINCRGGGIGVRYGGNRLCAGTNCRCRV